MNSPTRHVVSFLAMGLLLVGCSLPPQDTGSPLGVPTITTAPSPTKLPAVRTDSTEPRKSGPRLVTMADSDKTISLALGQEFTLDLGESPGSDWAVQLSPPDVLDPPVHQLGPQGSPIVFQPLKIGETVIEANSHGICLHPGPCPEVFLNFSLIVRVVAR